MTNRSLVSLIILISLISFGCAQKKETYDSYKDFNVVIPELKKCPRPTTIKKPKFRKESLDTPANLEILTKREVISSTNERNSDQVLDCWEEQYMNFKAVSDKLKSKGNANGQQQSSGSEEE